MEAPISKKGNRLSEASWNESWRFANRPRRPHCCNEEAGKPARSQPKQAQASKPKTLGNVRADIFDASPRGSCCPALISTGQIKTEKEDQVFRKRRKQMPLSLPEREKAEAPPSAVIRNLRDKADDLSTLKWRSPPSEDLVFDAGGIGQDACLLIDEYRSSGVENQGERTATNSQVAKGRVVASLDELVEEGKRFGTIYADPPWAYGNQGTRAAAGKHYPVMSLDKIRAEPIAKLAADPAHLHLWTTNGFLPEAFSILEAWGFTYKSCFIWVKPQIGTGNYWRVSHEFMLLGVKGKLCFQNHSQRSWVECPRTAHSRKPARVRELIETVSPGPYLEMYGRDNLGSSWTVYGNQVGKCDNGHRPEMQE